MRDQIKQEKNIRKEQCGYRVILTAFILLLTALLVIPSLAAAGRDRQRANEKRHPDNYYTNQRIVLDFGDSFLQGRNGKGSTLFLKRELKHQYPELDVSKLRLNEVVLVAKSRIGRGNVELRVGPVMSDVYRVAGRPQDFDRRHRHTFDRVRINAPDYVSKGPWQLNLFGTFKVRKVVLEVEQKGINFYSWRDKTYRSEPWQRNYYQRNNHNFW